MGYSIRTGLWKTFKNCLIVLGPSIVAFVAALPPEYQTQYAPILGIVLYFVKNYAENK
jgi:hypothetical protein